MQEPHQPLLGKEANKIQHPLNLGRVLRLRKVVIMQTTPCRGSSPVLKNEEEQVSTVFLKVSINM